MQNIDVSFEILNYLVAGTFVIILVEFAYSFYKKDGIYTIPGTMGNILNAFFMKFFMGNLGLISFVGYLTLYKKYYPSLDNLESYGIFSYIACVAIIDFTFYWYHRAHHYFEFLWAVHFVHHSDDKFNLSTSYRLSLIEKFYNLIVIIPAVFIGFDPYFAILCFYIISFYQFFIHSEYIKYPSFLDYLLITPGNHKVHHGQVFNEGGSNFALVFSLWDRFFRTYKKPEILIKIGIVNYHEDNFIKVQIDPIYIYFKKIYKKVIRFILP